METIRQYPGWAEEFWCRQACQATGVAELGAALESLEAEVQGLGDLFTTGRPDRFADYGQQARWRAAYGLYFFPQSFVRAAFPLAEFLDFHPGYWAGREAIHILDLGAGLGACGWGVVRLLRLRGYRQKVILQAVDHSPAQLRVLESFGRELREHLGEVEVRILCRDLRQLPADIACDLLLCGFALNEAYPEQSAEDLRVPAQAWASRLRPGGLVVILEPALQQLSRRLSLLGNLLPQDGWQRHGPFPGDGPDPLTFDPHRWNHEVRAWRTPQSLQFVNRHLWRDLQHLKFSHLVLGREVTALPSRLGEFAAGPGLFRLAAPMALLKGRFITAGVGTDGVLRHYDLPTRGLERATRDRLESIERGDWLGLREWQVLGGQESYRIPHPEAIGWHYQVR